jgi:hypothetical protein
MMMFQFKFNFWKNQKIHWWFQYQNSYQYHTSLHFNTKDQENQNIDSTNNPEVKSTFMNEKKKIEHSFFPKWFRHVFLDPDPSAPDSFVLDIFYRIYKLFGYMYKYYQKEEKKSKLLKEALEWKYGFRDWWKYYGEVKMRRRRPIEFDLYHQHPFRFDWKGYDSNAHVGIFEMYFWNILYPFWTEKPVPWGRLPQARALFGWDRWNPWMSNNLTPEKIESYRQWHPRDLRKKGFDLTSDQRWEFDEELDEAKVTQRWENKQLMKYYTPQIVYKNPKYIPYSNSISSQQNSNVSDDDWMSYLTFNMKYLMTDYFIYFFFLMFFWMIFLIMKFVQDKNSKEFNDDDLTAYEMMERWCIQDPFQRSIWSREFFRIFWMRFWWWIFEYACIVLSFCVFYSMIFWGFDKLYWIYSIFEFTCTIFLMIFFFYLFWRYYRQWKKEERWTYHEVYDYPFNAWKCLYFGSLFFSQLIKFFVKLQDQEIFWEYRRVWRYEYDWGSESPMGYWYLIADWIKFEPESIWPLIVAIHFVFIFWYLSIEHVDRWMGWNQKISKKTYRRRWEHRNYWNFKNAHFRMVKFKFYKFILKILLLILLPFFFIGRYLYVWLVSFHFFYTRMYNRIFWWKKKKYTFKEIQQQWRIDQKKWMERKEIQKQHKSEEEE